jgi:hypothetical protein
MVKHIKLILGSLFLLAGIPCLIWGNYPPGEKEVVNLYLLPEEMALPGNRTITSTIVPSEGRQVQLTIPKFARKGDIYSLTLLMEPMSSGSVPGSDDVYKTHNLVAQARLELEGVPYSPTNDVYSALRPEQPSIMKWLIRPESSGTFKATIWLHLQFMPHPDPFEEVFPSNRLLAAPEFEIETSSLLGLSGMIVRVIGGVSTVLGLVFISEPYIVAWIETRISRKDQGDGETTENV